MATDFIIKSNQASLILNTLKAAGVEDLSYSQPFSYPIIGGKEIIEVQPLQRVSGSIYGKKVRFDIPRSTMVRDMVLKTDFTTENGSAFTAGDMTKEQNSLIGVNLVESMELRTRSRTLCQNTQDGLRAWIDVAPMGEQLALKRRAKALNQTTGAFLTDGVFTGGDNYSATVYTRPKMFFQENTELNIDSGFVEQMQLVVTYNSKAYAGLVRDLQTITSTLYITYWQPELQYYNMIRSKNFIRATPLQQLVYDSITEINVATSTTENTFDIKVNVPAFVTFASILENQASSACDRFTINSFSASFTSRKLYDSLPALVGNLDSDLSGALPLTVTNSSSAVSLSDSSPLALFWGLEPSKWHLNSGAVSYAQIDSPSITLKHSTLTTASNFNVNFTHYFWALLSTDASNGSMIISSSV